MRYRHKEIRYPHLVIDLFVNQNYIAKAFLKFLLK